MAREHVEKELAYDELEAENDRLQRRVETLIEMREEHGELVEYVEREKSLQERREERERACCPAWRADLETGILVDFWHEEPESPASEA